MSSGEAGVLHTRTKVPMKTKFYTKYKMRSSKKEEPQSSRVQSTNQNKNYRAKTELSETQKEIPFSCSNLPVDNFKLINLMHNSQSCLCNECDCGRHLCKLHSQRRHLKSSTVYKDDFRKKKPIENIVNISAEYDPLMGPNLELRSVYLQDYSIKSAQLDNKRPSDSLKTQGPFMGLTSYSSGFPGHRGDNQYVKPTDSHLRGYFPMRCRTTYSQSYSGGASLKRNRAERAPDNLKTGYSWMGNSSYANSYSKPNPEYLVSPYKEVQKADIVPAYSQHQKSTVYKNSYNKHEIGVCPAKKVIAAWGKERGSFYKSKINFKENSDFRGMDTKFRPLSAVK